jgi:hypothetical protein
MKVRRQVVEERWRDVIDDLYVNPNEQSGTVQ